MLTIVYSTLTLLQVKFIGPMMSKKLQSHLESHCAANGLVVPQPPPPSPASAAAAASTAAARGADNGGRAKRQRTYVPRRRSAAHAILIALYRASQTDGYRGHMSKAEIVAKAQPLCDASFTIVKAGSQYAGWASMKTLIGKGMVEKAGNPARFSLTIEGEVLGQRLHDVETSDDPSNNDGDNDDDDDDDDDDNNVAHGKHRRRDTTLDGWARGTAKVHPTGSCAASLTTKSTATAGSAATGRGAWAGAGAAVRPTTWLPDSRKVYPIGGARREDVNTGWGAGDSALFSPVDSGRSLRASDFDLPVVPPELARLARDKDERGASPAMFSREASANWRDAVHSSSSFVLQPGEFDLVLAIDTSEHTGSRKDKGVIQQQLESMGVDTDVRRLTLGDFLWVAREKVIVSYHR